MNEILATTKYETGNRRSGYFTSLSLFYTPLAVVGSAKIATMDKGFFNAIRLDLSASGQGVI